MQSHKLFISMVIFTCLIKPNTIALDSKTVEILFEEKFQVLYKKTFSFHPVQILLQNYSTIQYKFCCRITVQYSTNSVAELQYNTVQILLQIYSTVQYKFCYKITVQYSTNFVTDLQYSTVQILLQNYSTIQYKFCYRITVQHSTNFVTELYKKNFKLILYKFCYRIIIDQIIEHTFIMFKHVR